MAIGEGTASSNQGRHDWAERGVTVGFFTDPTVCIGCKACEVACKEWNGVPADGTEWRGSSYDHTGALGASTWRHVKFLEQPASLGRQVAGSMGAGGAADLVEDPFRWVFLSDVCKHCENAGCLEACPTGSIVRTEVGSVYVQDDVCNGCGYCVVGCPFGVIDRRPEPLEGAGGAFKCTFCYDRQLDGRTPACAKACPTESIRFGPLDELREEAGERVAELKARGVEDASLYDARDTSVGGTHAMFLLLGDPEPWGEPPSPEVPTIRLRTAWASAFFTAVVAVAATFAAFLWA
ncbi:MAG: 4Fe-4S dicluster domain-containing protein [Gemmatimonadota bacterium]|nr:4Fe-4S dicluster domain-containing protein [Gemmatimonadota bacterium]